MSGLKSSAELKRAIGEIHIRIIALERERGELPRNARVRAGELFNEIGSLRARMQRLRPELSAAQKLEQAQARHGLWAQAVTALYGADAVRACSEWMNHKRREIKMEQKQ